MKGVQTGKSTGSENKLVAAGGQGQEGMGEMRNLIMDTEFFLGVMFFLILELESGSGYQWIY